MSKELEYPFHACATAQEAVKNADVVFTQTTGGEWVLEEDWLSPHATIIASGTDQPTKNELPPSVMSKAKFVTDITAQCSRVGELRSAIEAGVMTADDVHIEGAPTWTVKLAMVSFYNNVKKGLPAGSGVFVVCDATNGGPKAVLHENRYLTDLRAGAAGAVAVKHLAVKGAKSVAFIGTGVTAEAMARSSTTVHGFDQGFGYSRDMAKNSAFCDKMSKELGYDFTPCSSAEEAVKNADVVFTQTTGAEWVLEEDWLRPHATIIASGSDQPTKNEIPPAVMQKAQVVTDITAQCLRVGELRSAVEAGVMKETDVHAELGEVINGSKKGRSGEELIVCDLTGTGAQDAAIGSYVMKVLD